MTNIQFYILSQNSPMERWRFGCRLTEKARGLGHEVYLHTHNLEEAQHVSDMLWTISPQSFLPHEIIGHADHADLHHNGILIGHTLEHLEAHFDTLINFTDSVPAGFTQYQKMAEIVIQTEDDLAKSRERWKYYQQRGYPLHSHQLS